MLVARNLVKSFGNFEAVKGISMTVEKGRILGLLGPNGAGKTTTVAMLCGLLSPDSGEILLSGRPLQGDTDPNKRNIGLVPHEIALYEEMSARDNLSFFGGLYGLAGRRLAEAVSDTLELVGLSERAGDPVSTFSGGMQRRLNLAAGILHNPEVLLLDEPTVGIDPQSRNAIFERIETLRSQGKAILYTTHYLEEAERLCDSVLILDHGSLMAQGSISELAQSFSKEIRLNLELELPPPQSILDQLSHYPGVQKVESEREKIHIRIDDLTQVTPGILAFLGEQGIRIRHLTSERAGLDEIFLTLTGRSMRNS
jgi:ABC-2 type transport system ATP-binding protein